MRMYVGHSTTKAHADLDGLWSSVGVLNFPVQAGELGVVSTAYPVAHAFRYGAAGSGGVDDTVALQAMLTAMGTVFPRGCEGTVPIGTYKITAPLIPPGQNAFVDSSKHRIRGVGAQIFSYDATPGRSAFKLNAMINTEGTLTLDGLTIDGANAAAGVNGIEIHCGNVKLERCVVRNFVGGYGITYINDLAAPPICTEISSCEIQNNRIGIYSAVPTSDLYIQGGRVEHNKEENILLDGCGKFCLVGVTCENGGDGTPSKANLYVKNATDGSIIGCYFESNLYQDHSSVVIEGILAAPCSIAFIGNRVVGSYCNIAGVPLLNSIGLDVAPNGGAVDGFIEFGNYIFGQTTNVRIGVNCRGSTFGPDSFADSSGGGSAWSGATNYQVRDLVSSGGNSYVCILAHNNQVPPNATYWTPITLKRYNIISVLANEVNDVNRFAAAIFNKAVFQGLLATSVTISGQSVQGAGKIYKDAALGLVQQGVAGATSDFALLTPGASAVMEVPTGTIVAQHFGAIQESAIAIVYAAAMTPNVGTGTAAATSGNIQTITATNNTAFTINAPTGARAGMRLRIRIRNTSGGALGVATWNAVFKMVAWVQPATGFSRSIDFDYDGANWVEAGRSATDVAN